MMFSLETAQFEFCRQPKLLCFFLSLHAFRDRELAVDRESVQCVDQWVCGSVSRHRGQF